MIKPFGKEIKDLDEAESRQFTLALTDYAYHMRWGNYWPLGTLTDPYQTAQNNSNAPATR